MINFIWILVVSFFIVSQWYVIEKLGKYPNKPLWFLIRAIIAGVFLFFYVNQGYVWYWSLFYMIFTFWFPYNSTLNLLRGKPIMYLSPKNSFIDYIFLKIFRYEFAIFGYSLILFIAALGIMYFYGYCTWSEINAGLCTK